MIINQERYQFYHIYTDIKRGMRQDQDEETMRGYEEELRKILNK